MHSRRHAINIDMNDDMGNAREGIVYFWSQIEPVSGLSICAGFAKDNPIKAGTIAYNTYGSINYDNRTGLEKGADKANSFSQTMELKNWCDRTVAWLFEIIGVKKVIDDSVAWISKYLLKTFSPFVGDIVGGVKGLYKFSQALVHKVELWWKGRNVKLNAGHPQAIAKAIGALLNNSMLDGLYKLIKSVVSASLKFITVGVSTIASLIANTFEAIIRLIYTFKEARYINDFISKCKEYWKLPKVARMYALTIDAQAFNNAFKDATENAPIIGAITFNTHIAGDKMRFLNMYTEKQVVSKSQFKAGASYLDSLKSTSRSYVKKWGSRLNTQDNFVKGLLRIIEHGANAVNPPKKAWYKFW